jgi:5-methyltetrahydropteroyltriglutamate--homocysteine methyltransferase
MPLRDSPPFRADHVGSLLRPPELVDAREEPTVEGNMLTREQQADKLRLIVEVAEEVWG